MTDGFKEALGAAFCLALLRLGFTKPHRSPGALVGSYPTVSPLPRIPTSGTVRRFAFCGTFPDLTTGRRYRPPCPVEPGLSSRYHDGNQRTSDQLGSLIMVTPGIRGQGQNLAHIRNPLPGVWNGCQQHRWQKTADNCRFVANLEHFCQNSCSVERLERLDS